MCRQILHNSDGPAIFNDFHRPAFLVLRGTWLCADPCERGRPGDSGSTWERGFHSRESISVEEFSLLVIYYFGGVIISLETNPSVTWAKTGDKIATVRIESCATIELWSNVRMEQLFRVMIT